jgi:hypothetical protein
MWIVRQMTDRSECDAYPFGWVPKTVPALVTIPRGSSEFKKNLTLQEILEPLRIRDTRITIHLIFTNLPKTFLGGD